MKKNYLSIFILTLLLVAQVFAQSPEKMCYQAVIRDGSNELLSEQQVGLQIRILQGQDPSTATAIYTETQTAMTNVNGLLSLEIGTGATSDDFSLIDWSIGSYFIETNTDPLGGTDYSITGTNQLLSVPYALHAKTAESVTETQTLTDVVALGNTVNNQLKSVTDPTDAQDAVTKAYVDVLEAKLAALEDRISAIEPIQLEIGDSYLGGIIFDIFEPGDPGYEAGETHGLIAATSDQSVDPIEWTVTDFMSSDIPFFTTNDSHGYTNTEALVKQAIWADANTWLVENTFAAGLCHLYSVTNNYQEGWYLPSKNELDLMYKNIGGGNVLGLGNIGNFYGTYWSSTEDSAPNDYFVWVQDFSNGNSERYLKGLYFRVRAIRAF